MVALAEGIARVCERHRFWLLSVFSAFYLIVVGLISVQKQLANDELFTLNIARLPSLADVWSALSTTTGDACDALLEAYVKAVDAATECSPFEPVVQCDGSIVLLDTCACPSIVANEHASDLATVARDAYDAWVAAGCGPIPCEQCIPAKGGTCLLDRGGSTGHCVGVTPL
jgi:hypothetical protein